MSLTLLAGILTPFYLMVVLDPKRAQKAIKEMMKNEGVMLSFSFFYFLLAAIILSSTGFNFQWQWESLLAWLGLAVFVKGVFFLLAPQFMEKWVKKFKTNTWPVLGFVGLLFCLALVYVDLKVLV